MLYAYFNLYLGDLHAKRHAKKVFCVSLSNIQKKNTGKLKLSQAAQCQQQNYHVNTMCPTSFKSDSCVMRMQMLQHTEYFSDVKSKRGFGGGEGGLRIGNCMDLVLLISN